MGRPPRIVDMRVPPRLQDPLSAPVGEQTRPGPDHFGRLSEAVARSVNDANASFRDWKIPGFRSASILVSHSSMVTLATHYRPSA